MENGLQTDRQTDKHSFEYGQCNKYKVGIEYAHGKNKLYTKENVERSSISICVDKSSKLSKDNLLLACAKTKL